jgi:hypothetical protein
MKAESPTDPLRNVVVELRNSNGAIIRSMRTSNTGAYSFPGMSAASNPYYVAVVPGRNQVATPSQAKVNVGDQTPFLLRGVPATVQVVAPPSTFVLITQGTFTGTKPPSVNQMGGNPPPIQTATVGLNGRVNFSLTQGNYHITCWTPQVCGSRTLYLRTPATGSFPLNGGGLVDPIGPGEPLISGVTCHPNVAACP